MSNKKYEDIFDKELSTYLTEIFKSADKFIALTGMRGRADDEDIGEDEDLGYVLPNVKEVDCDHDLLEDLSCIQGDLGYYLRVGYAEPEDRSYETIYSSNELFELLMNVYNNAERFIQATGLEYRVDMDFEGYVVPNVEDCDGYHDVFEDIRCARDDIKFFMRISPEHEI